MVLSTRFEQALTYAAILHSGQVKKGTAVPYIGHLLTVTGIALEHGADEDEAIAALLHDAVEDAGGKGRLADIRGRFGERVATIVEGCTDTDVTPKPEWNERKRQYVERLRREKNPSVPWCVPPTSWRTRVRFLAITVRSARTCGSVSAAAGTERSGTTAH